METLHSTPFSVLVGRMAWLFVCPMLLLIVTLLILLRSDGWLTLVDAAFFLVIGLALVGRWAEFRGENPQTAYGEPATELHLRRYLIVAPIAGVLLWVVANILGNHVITTRF